MISLNALPLRVLVVDDLEEGRRAMARVLRSQGIAVETADNGQDAIHQIERAMASGLPFGLVLMDMQMPVMDGFSATEYLRQNQYHGRIVAVTGMENARERCLRAGCDAFLARPVTLDALLKVVEHCREIAEMPEQNDYVRHSL
jgi:CheY-like chemotaxis protein